VYGFAEGLKCYTCNSKYDPNCGHPFDPSTIELMDCQQTVVNATRCRKQHQKGMFYWGCGYFIVMCECDLLLRVF